MRTLRSGTFENSRARCEGLLTIAVVSSEFKRILLEAKRIESKFGGFVSLGVNSWGRRRQNMTTVSRKRVVTPKFMISGLFLF